MEKEKTNKQFNIVILGVGGQGQISLARLIAQASLDSGFDVKTSELHGLSQREGSVKVEVRFGRKIYSPLIGRGRADLIFSLELQEALAGLETASGHTQFLINQYELPVLGKVIPEKEVLNAIKKITKKIVIIPANQICQRELGTTLCAGTFLLALALKKNLLPLTQESFSSAIKKILPEKHWELNLKTLLLVEKDLGIR